MKKSILLFLCVFMSLSLQANPTNLYEQLCEVNQEWFKNRALAERLGLLALPPIKDEQELLVKHIQLLENIFTATENPHLAHAQRQARRQNLRVLHEYWQRRDCPRNYYLPYRNPVFIDHEGRYCAVGYLMLKSGLQTFCESVQKTNNFIFIRQIEHSAFHAWQQESGLSIDELAWIQPGYDPEINFIDWNKCESTGKLSKIDSASVVSVYNNYYDQTDMFGLQRMFWGLRKSPEKIFKKFASQYKGKTPDWNKLGFPFNTLTVYKNEVYVAVDTIQCVDINDTTSQCTTISKVLKWNKKGEWETVFEVTDGNIIYCFFESRGKLHAGGGGKTTVSEKPMIIGDYTHYPNEVHSFLASTNGITGWKVSQKEFGGIIFGLVYKNKKRYLGTVYNNMSDIEIGAPLRE